MAISPAPTRRLPLIRLTLLVGSIVVVALGITWTYLGMRAVMDIGGACASGGPYVPVRPCPDGATSFLAVGFLLMVFAVVVGTAVAALLGAPTPILPMWFLLFGALGWNFLEYAFTFQDSVVVGWLVCGIVFELMALPAAALWLVGGAFRIPLIGSTRTEKVYTYWLVYAVVGTVGLLLGFWSYQSWT